MKISRLAVIGIAIVLVGLGLIGAMVVAEPSKAAVVAPEIQYVDTTPVHLEHLKEDLITRLIGCESAGHSEDDAIILYDNNSAGTLKGKTVFSLGQLQFKVSTIQHYAEQRDGTKLSQKEAVHLAFDTPKARDLAGYIIFETKGGIDNWLNCSSSLGLHEEVAVLKKLSR